MAIFIDIIGDFVVIFGDTSCDAVDTAAVLVKALQSAIDVSVVVGGGVLDNVGNAHLSVWVG